jgi:hypothetical protein
MARPSVHAVYNVLNPEPFFAASLSSVYEFVSGVTVVTRYDRDNYGAAVAPGGLVDLVLSRRLDPERKVNLIVTSEGKEPRSRNRAMAFAGPSPRVKSLPGAPASIATPDLFWHVDADEVYDPADVVRLLAWVERHRAPAYRLELRTYFRTWNWQVEEKGSFVALTRPRFRFGHIRDRYPSAWVRGWAKLALMGVVSEPQALRRTGQLLVPPSVAVCHHGSYVGPRDRIEAKLARSVHKSERVDGWLERVWDAWTPEMRDLHPTRPDRFPVATHVPTADLPPAIRDHRWPPGWIEPLDDQVATGAPVAGPSPGP